MQRPISARRGFVPMCEEEKGKREQGSKRAEFRRLDSAGKAVRTRLLGKVDGWSGHPSQLRCSMALSVLREQRGDGEFGDEHEMGSCADGFAVLGIQEADERDADLAIAGVGGMETEGPCKACSRHVTPSTLEDSTTLSCTAQKLRAQEDAIIGEGSGAYISQLQYEHAAIVPDYHILLIAFQSFQKFAQLTPSLNAQHYNADRHPPWPYLPRVLSAVLQLPAVSAVSSALRPRWIVHPVPSWVPQPFGRGAESSQRERWLREKDDPVTASEHELGHIVACLLFIMVWQLSTKGQLPRPSQDSS